MQIILESTFDKYVSVNFMFIFADNFQALI